MKLSNFTLLLMAICLRMYLLFIPSFKIDMDVWKAWTHRLLTTPIPDFYSPTYFSDYPPLYLYYLFITGKIFTLFNGLESLGSFQYDIFFKVLILVFDLLSGLIVYKIIKNHLPKRALLITAIYLLNPVILLDGVVWGQNDSILIFLLLLSCYLLFERSKYKLAVFIFSLAFLVKFQAITALPVIGIFILKRYKPKQWLISLLIGVSTIIVLSYPFYLNSNPFSGLLELAQKSSSIYPYTSINAFNFWAFNGFWKSDTRDFLFTNFHQIGTALFLIFLLPILLKLFLQKKITSINYYFGISLSFLAFFLLLTRMHERYLAPYFAFSILLSILSFKEYLATYILLSIISSLNIFYVYYYYNFIYNNPSAENNLIYTFIDNNYIWFSLINIIIFIYLLTKFLAFKKDV